MRTRAGLVTLIYTKSLVLSNDEHSRASGDIVNLMSVDASRIQEFCAYGLMAISGPLQVKLVIIDFLLLVPDLPRLFWHSSHCIIFLDGQHLLEWQL